MLKKFKMIKDIKQLKKNIKSNDFIERKIIMIYSKIDFEKIKKLFLNLLNKNLTLNLIAPLPDDCECNFEANLLNDFVRLKQKYVSKIKSDLYEYDSTANVNIYFHHIRSNESRIKIVKNFSFTRNVIHIIFFYKNKHDLYSMLNLYNNSMKIFFNPLEINLKNNLN